MRRAWALGFIKFHLPFALSVTQKWQIFFPKFVWGIDDSTDKTAKPYTGSHVCTDVKKGCLENDDLENNDLENDDVENADLENDDLENDDLENNDLENDDLENNDLENDDLKNDDLENDDLENDDLENDDLENDDLENDDRDGVAQRIKGLEGYRRQEMRGR